MKVLIFISILFFVNNLLAVDSFEVQYVDSDGVEWSKDIGSTTNGCSGLTYTCTQNISFPDDSHAVKLCDALDGHIGNGTPRLPRRVDYFRLIKDFDYIEKDFDHNRPVLTKLGKEQFEKVFGNHWEEKFWTSSVNPAMITVAYIYWSYFGSVDYFESRQDKHRVRCIR